MDWVGVLKLGERQHGLITVPQLKRLGLTREALRWKRTTGQLERLNQRVYRLPGAAVTWHQRCLAASLGAGRGAVVSHLSAAALLGLDGLAAGPPRLIDLTVPRSRTPPRLPGVRVHRTTAVLETVRARGMTVTSVAQTLVDLAADLELEQLELVMDGAQRSRPGLPAELDALLARARWVGATKVRRVLEQRSGAPTDSSLELKVLRRLRRHRFRPPVHQLNVHDHRGFVIRVDFAWPAHRVALHVDSYRWHQQRARFERDREQLARLTALGWKSIHVTSEGLSKPEWVMGLRAALRDGAGQLRIW